MTPNNRPDIFIIPFVGVSKMYAILFDDGKYIVLESWDELIKCAASSGYSLHPTLKGRIQIREHGQIIGKVYKVSDFFP